MVVGWLLCGVLSRRIVFSGFIPIFAVFVETDGFFSLGGGRISESQGFECGSEKFRKGRCVWKISFSSPVVLLRSIGPVNKKLLYYEERDSRINRNLPLWSGV